MFSFLMLLFLPYCIKTLHKPISDLTLEEFLGVHVAQLFAPLFHVDSTLLLSIQFQRDWFGIILIVAGFFYAFFNFSCDYSIRAISEKLVLKLRTAIFQTYLSLTYREAVEIEPGFLGSLVGENIREMQDSFTRITCNLIKEGVLATLLIIWLLFLDYELFLLFLGILLPAVFIVVFTHKKIKKFARQGLALESTLMQSLLETVKGWETIKVYRKIDFELERFSEVNGKVFDVWKRLTKIKSFAAPFLEWFFIVAAAVILFSALKRISDHGLSTQVLLSFIITLGYIADKINRISQIFNTARKGLEALSRIQNFINRVPEGERHLFSDKNLNELNHEKVISLRKDIFEENVNSRIQTIELKNVSIADQESQCLLKELDLSFKTGDIIAIGGPSGVGKTTFLKSLLGLEPPFSGEVLLNGKLLTESQMLLFKDQITFIPQDPYIFEGTIAENIMYPDDGSSSQEEDVQARIDRVLELVNLAKDPQERVKSLSGGERQRLLFARLFYRNSSLIIIDEGTSALDFFNENNLLDQLVKRSKNSIIIIIAHRPGVKQYATRYIDFSDYSLKLASSS